MRAPEERHIKTKFHKILRYKINKFRLVQKGFGIHNE